MTPDELRRYSELIVRGCIAFRRGDSLLGACGPRSPRPRGRVSPRLPTAPAPSAVDVEYQDGRVDAARIAYASKRGARPAHLVAARKHARARRRAGGGRADHRASTGSTWSPACRPSASPRTRSGWRPTPRWRGSAAKDGCAGRSARGRRTSGRRASSRGSIPTQAQRRLAKDLLWFCRLGPKDPAGAHGLDTASRDAAAAGRRG